MKMSYRSIHIYSTVAAAAFILTASQVRAQNGDGTVNAGFYGSPLAVQTINTGFGNAAGGNDSGGGSELDAAYGTVSGGICTCSWRATSRITVTT